MIDIKTGVDEDHLKHMRSLTESYAGLFSKAALKYRSMGLHERELSEEELRDYILQEYTFLRRPVAIIGNTIFIGNTKKNIEALNEAVQRISE